MNGFRVKASFYARMVISNSLKPMIATENFFLEKMIVSKYDYFKGLIGIIFNSQQLNQLRMPEL